MSEKTFTWDEIEAAVRGGHVGVMSASELEIFRKRLFPAPTTPWFGIYNDLGFDKSMQHLAKTAKLGLDEEVIMLESSREGFDPKWTPDQLEAYHFRTGARRKVLTVWPEPTAEWLRAFRGSIQPYLDACPVFAIDFDSEMKMKEKYVEGFPSLRAFGDWLMAFARELQAEGLIQEIQVDTFPGHREAHGGDSLEGEDMFYLQSYPVYRPRRKVAGRYGPLYRAGKDAAFVRAKGQDEPMSVVLPTWGMSGWGNPASRMLANATDAAGAGYERFRWWSLKHVVGPKENTYAAEGIVRSVTAIKEARGWK